MEVRIASEAAPGKTTNEDYAFALPDLVGVLDGVSVPDGLDTGCIHGPAWYVRRLATHLARAHVKAPMTALAESLAEAIAAVRDDHQGQCDLGHPGTPAGTVSLLRRKEHDVDYLILCDSPLVIDQGDEVQAVTDERFAHAVAELRAAALTGQDAIDSNAHRERVRRTVLAQRHKTNKPDGYWIAAATPEAALHAVTGTLPLTGPDRVRRAALLTDGASCAVEQYDLYDWRGLLDLLASQGPNELIRRVRAAEDTDSSGYAKPRYKRHDDATAALCLFDQE